MPKVSICIPAYNRPAMLLEAIASVRQQTNPDWELVISHDGLNAEIRAAVAAVGDERIRYFENPVPLRVPGNWNRCIREAHGEFVQILPDDDVLCPRFIERALTGFEAHPTAGFVQTSGYNCDPELRPLISFRVPGQGFRRGVEALQFQFDTLRCAPVTLLFRRQALVAAGLWREDYLDDWATILKIAHRHGFYYLEEELGGVRAHAQKYSSRMARDARDGINDLINQTLDVFGAAMPSDEHLLRLFRQRLKELASHSAKSAIGRLLGRDFTKAAMMFRRAMLLDPTSVLLGGFLVAWFKQREYEAIHRGMRENKPLADMPLHLWAKPAASAEPASAAPNHNR